MKNTDHADVPPWAELEMFWLENKLAVTFHSPISLSDEGSSLEDIIKSLHLDNLNQYLNERGFNLTSATSQDIPQPLDSEGDRKEDRREQRENPITATLEDVVESLKRRIEDLEQQTSGRYSNKSERENQDINNLRGKYLFSPPSGKGTIVVGFFNIEAVSMPHAIQDMRVINQRGGCFQDGSNTRQVVNIINHDRQKLRKQAGIPIVSAMPDLLGSGSPHCNVGGGCPIAPFPVPTNNKCSSSPGLWPFTLPDLGPASPLQEMTGEGVTMFVLDTMPELQPDDDILKAAKRAGNDNLLLQTVAAEIDGSGSPFIKRKYQILPALLSEHAPDTIEEFSRDIYGRPDGFDKEDHGLFVLGIVRDLASEANIEYYRVLNDYAVGDFHTLIHALAEISERMERGDLRNKPVVINLSLVAAPSKEELADIWFGPDCSCSAESLAQRMSDTDDLLTGLHIVIQGLTSRGAIIVAAAGNDSNTPDRPMRVGPRYPAAFPEVISVGAVGKDGKAAIYSNYPALPPNHNGIATYGGGLPIPVPIVGTSGIVPPNTFGPDVHVMTGATGIGGSIDAVIGLYSSLEYPKLAADDPLPNYEAPKNDTWAYWSGTSFATPIISAVAARVLQKIRPNLPSHLWSAEVQWAITTATGQKVLLTGDQPLALQNDFSQSGVGVSLLRAYQCSEPDNR